MPSFSAGTFVLDNAGAPPANMIIAVTPSVTQRRECVLTVMTRPEQVYPRLTALKVWGDIDPSCPLADGQWHPYEALTALVVSAGDGTKEIHAKVANDYWVESEQMTASLTLTAQPHASLLWSQTDPLAANYHIGFSVSHDVEDVALAIVPHEDSPPSDSYIVKQMASGMTAGSSGVMIVSLNEFTLTDEHPERMGDRLCRLYVKVDGEWQ